jgi:hypothetical protein
VSIIERYPEDEWFKGFRIQTVVMCS